MKIQDIPTHKFLEQTPDLENRLPADGACELRLWLRLLSCTTLIENELRSRLRKKYKTTLPRFELMAQLAEQPEGLKMSELSRKMLVTNGNITGIADQLEKEGVVERQRVLHDRRSSVIRLTEKGQTLYKQIALVYNRWVDEFFGPLSSDNKENLLAALNQVKILARLNNKENT